MGIKWAKFLDLQKVHNDDFTISRHATSRIEECIGFDPGVWMSVRLLREDAHMVTFDKLKSLGYRPRYYSRRNKGSNSWYFRFTYKDKEMIAVITENDDKEGLHWVTTLYRNKQTDILLGMS